MHGWLPSRALLGYSGAPSFLCSLELSYLARLRIHAQPTATCATRRDQRLLVRGALRLTVCCSQLCSRAASRAASSATSCAGPLYFSDVIRTGCTVDPRAALPCNGTAAGCASGPGRAVLSLVSPAEGKLFWRERSVRSPGCARGRIRTCTVGRERELLAQAGQPDPKLFVFTPRRVNFISDHLIHTL